MATVNDVAAYLLAKHGPMTAMKLQKLVYYSQAWSLVWDEKPLFKERIEAWAMGPVVPQLYEQHRGMFEIRKLRRGNADSLSAGQGETIDIVLGFYGAKSSQWLSDQTHQEAPWRDARRGCPAGTACDREITHAAMAEYYGSLE